MARAKRYQFIVLAEGMRDYHFARRYLEERYKDRAHVVRSQTIADGKGAAMAMPTSVQDACGELRRLP